MGTAVSQPLTMCKTGQFDIKPVGKYKLILLLEDTNSQSKRQGSLRNVLIPLDFNEGFTQEKFKLTNREMIYINLYL